MFFTCSFFFSSLKLFYQSCMIPGSSGNIDIHKMMNTIYKSDMFEDFRCRNWSEKGRHMEKDSRDIDLQSFDSACFFDQEDNRKNKLPRLSNPVQLRLKAGVRVDLL
jgi:hypothetical protein